ncbi:MAG: hypothetical protein QOD89_2639, partial [Bradyrhizobium sp.]|nr:hypothetical protein [Bradyrhizobium sp.]
RRSAWPRAPTRQRSSYTTWFCAPVGDAPPWRIHPDKRAQTRLRGRGTKNNLRGWHLQQAGVGVGRGPGPLRNAGIGVAGQQPSLHGAKVVAQFRPTIWRPPNDKHHGPNPIARLRLCDCDAWNGHRAVPGILTTMVGSHRMGSARRRPVAPRIGAPSQPARCAQLERPISSTLSLTVIGRPLRFTESSISRPTPTASSWSVKSDNRLAGCPFALTMTSPSSPA